MNNYQRQRMKALDSFIRRTFLGWLGIAAFIGWVVWMVQKQGSEREDDKTAARVEEIEVMLRRAYTEPDGTCFKTSEEIHHEAASMQRDEALGLHH